MKITRAAFTAITFFCVTCITSCSQSASWKGKIVYNYGEEVRQFDLSGKTNKALFKKAKQPFVSTNGEIFFITDEFAKRNLLVRKSNPGFTQFRDVLDMSSDNERYKDQLAAYSVINGTGISAILDRVSDPRVSPDGKYLAVTIFGYPGQAFPGNCVAVFDMASKTLLKQFDDMYYPGWLPDGRILAAGSHKTVSTDGGEYHSKKPGIFIINHKTGEVNRIDPELNDPAPYHPVASPDGKKVAFVMNDHVWVMNLDGGHLKQVTAADNDNNETFPVWSPDGKFIAAWTFKTFERSYYTALAIVPSNPAKPVVLSDGAAVWPRDKKKDRISGGGNQLNWLK